MQLVDSWRLFGPNLQTGGPAALTEVAFDAGEDIARAVDAWRGELLRMAAAIGLPVPDAAARLFRGGAVLTFSSTIDVLLPATDLNEWAAQSAVSVLRGDGPLALEPQRTHLAQLLRERTSPVLLALEAEAARRGLPFTWDDELLTIGAGKASATWPLTALPAIESVAWDTLRAIPLALVTGTNGKTTSARLLGRILKHMGHVVGMTTTDGIWADERLVEGGDFTGPAGATSVMRMQGVDAAVLETARGGILRRGVAVRTAGVALLTNVSDDHLGHYGIDNLGMLARVKAVVGTVIPATGRVVVNADDEYLMAQVSSFAAPLVLFSLDPANEALVAHAARGTEHEAWTLRDGWIVRLAGEGSTRVALVKDLPITFGGAARYNIGNAMGAAAAARVLGATDDQIRRALTTFRSDAADNPGRGNLVDVRGVSVLVDFGHNPAGIRSVLELVQGLRVDAPAQRSRRLAIVAGYAGDRSDESARDAARAIFEAKPARVVLRDLKGYLRGRQPGEIPVIFRAELLALGLPADAVQVIASEAEGLRAMLDWAEPGDFIVILAHLESAEVRAVIAEAQSK